MELTAIIIFFGSLIGLILWITRTILFFSNPKTRVHMIMGDKMTINISIPLILFTLLAISAGVAWG